ncbi:hypothetical protein LG296_04660 [Ureibacillus chungkukjangi]|uniref:hypothetical protein n=1 Tax=Ureibacillus chungkukjangi TaxID=1202712 RepID=UPI0038511BA7
MLEMAVMGKREGLSVPLNASSGSYGEKRRVVSAPKCWKWQLWGTEKGYQSP